jgi:hypothetical protein
MKRVRRVVGARHTLRCNNNNNNNGNNNNNNNNNSNNDNSDNGNIEVRRVTW